MGKVVMYSSVSVDGFVADENDQPGPLFDWLTSGDVPLDESGFLKVSRTSHDYTRSYWDQIGVTICGRHVFDLTDGWDGKPPSGIDHMVVVTHRPPPELMNALFFSLVICAMASATEEELHRRISESAGVDASWQPFHVVDDQLEALREDVLRVRAHPLIPERVRIGGFLYDVDTGRLTQHV